VRWRAAWRAGDLTRARQLFEESVAIVRVEQIFWFLLWLLEPLAECAYDQDDLERAASAWRETLVMAVRLRLRSRQTRCLAGLAEIAAKQGRNEVAARLWGSVRAEEDAYGASLSWGRTRNERLLAPLATFAAFEEGRSMALDDAAEYALANTD
jgi:hypothetical protein